MTSDELFRVARIMTMADHGCRHCAAELIQILVDEYTEEFPEVEAAADAAWKEAFGDVRDWRDESL